MNYESIPAPVMHAIKMHVIKGQGCGHFVTACLENNLRESIFRADDNSLAVLADIVRYLYNKCPAECWGSAKRVEEWQNKGGLGDNEEAKKRFYDVVQTHGDEE